MRDKSYLYQNNRKASAPPATPGYGTDNTSHPAYYSDPDADNYEIGGPYDFGEEPRPYGSGYPEGNPPATPGYDTDDQDHPAHKRLPRVPKSAKTKDQIESTVRKAYKLAELTFRGRRVASSVLMDQALDYTEMDPHTLDNSIARLEGYDPVEDEFVPVDEFVPDYDGIYASDDNEEEEEPEEKKPEAKTASQKKAAVKRAAVRKMFACMDTDQDGFVSQDEWTQGDDLFSALDTDGDGILALEEVVDMMAGDEEEKPEFTEEEKKALKEAKISLIKKAKKKAEEDEEKTSKKKSGDEDEEKTSKKKSDDKKGKKKAAEEEPEEDDESEDDESEDEDPPTDDEEDGVTDASDEEDDGESGEEETTETDDENESEDEDQIGKSACGDEDMWSLQNDPLMLNGDPVVSDEEMEVLNSLYASDDEEEGDEEPAQEPKTAGKKSASKTASKKPAPAGKQKPQVSTKANPGLRSVGNISSMSRTASDKRVNLNNLWSSAPDVSDIFKS